jgi:hypothetical protein
MRNEPMLLCEECGTLRRHEYVGEETITRRQYQIWEEGPGIRTTGTLNVEMWKCKVCGTARAFGSICCPEKVGAGAGVKKGTKRGKYKRASTATDKSHASDQV